MYLRRDELARTIRSPAKLNLCLNVCGRRDDGFHELETLMVPVRMWDGLTISPMPPDSFTPENGIELDVRLSFHGCAAADRALVPRSRDNLVVRALEALRRRSGCLAGARVELVKRIPVGAGLGGGSSDAAAALRLANVGWQLGWSRQQLSEVAAEIGSDVPFFLAGRAAVCRGRGEEVEPIHGARPLHFVLVKPPVGLSTADVYRAYDGESRQDGGPSCIGEAISGLRSGRLMQLASAMRNALETAAARLTPWVEQVRSAFADLDFLAHQLSGSGSAYFGLCRHRQHAHRLASVLKNRGVGLVYALRSCP
jgi:4-diphosphocytidyl-2-C-methyl-D-erythritol kinase